MPPLSLWLTISSAYTYFFPLNNRIIPLIPLFITSTQQRDSGFLLLQTNASIRESAKKDGAVKQQGGIALQSNPLLRSCLITLICTQTRRYGDAVQRACLFSSNRKELHRFIFELLLQILGVNQS